MLALSRLPNNCIANSNKCKVLDSSKSSQYGVAKQIFRSPVPCNQKTSAQFKNQALDVCKALCYV